MGFDHYGLRLLQVKPDSGKPVGSNGVDSANPATVSLFPGCTEIKPGSRSRLRRGGVIIYAPDGFAMRRRLKNFLPIMLIALMVQIFAPIGACWAASIAASDPLAGAVICHGNAASTSSDKSDQAGHRAHDGCCSVCSVLQTGAPVDMPETAVAIVFERQPVSVVWLDFAPGLHRSRAGSHAQARAPPSIS
jgi:DUF2946 family protein